MSDSISERYHSIAKMKQAEENTLESGQHLQQTLLNGLHGRGSHLNPANVFEDLDCKLVVEHPSGVPHSIWQIINHMIYWQEFSLALLSNDTPKTPEHASDSWMDTAIPARESEWISAVNTFLEGLHAAKGFIDDLDKTVAARQGRSRAEVIGMLIGHNSYHLGQIVFLRQILGAWLPSLGDTW